MKRVGLLSIGKKGKKSIKETINSEVSGSKAVPYSNVSSYTFKGVANLAGLVVTARIVIQAYVKVSCSR